ncbi:MAG TPA: hypothetical protein VKG82_01275 [Solirubrobacteraceae bacterium]|nr:hypothetical protein [Solirubrobacteraceae bacterium]
MVLLALIACWLVVVTLVACMCGAARRGDLAPPVEGSQRARAEPTWDQEPFTVTARSHAQRAHGGGQAEHVAA